MNQETAMKVLESGDNIFLTGDAGTGKSWLLTEYLDRCKKSRKSVLKFAPTGTAAIHIGGQTLHKGFAVPYEFPQMVKQGYIDTSKRYGYNRAMSLKNADVIVIDEISMVTPALLDYVQTSLDKVGFHGQVIACGDFYQLPPVKDKNTDSYIQLKGKDYCFESEAWKKFNFHPIMLTVPMRQKDNDILEPIQRVRNGDESVIKDLEKFVQNENVDMDEAVILCGRNDTASRINNEKISKLPCFPVHVKASDYSTDKNGVPTIKNIDTDLLLKLDSRIMINVNDGDDGRYANGTMGNVHDIYLHGYGSVRGFMAHLDDIKQCEEAGDMQTAANHILNDRYFGYYRQFMPEYSYYDEIDMMIDEKSTPEDVCKRFDNHVQDLFKNGVYVRSNHVNVDVECDNGNLVSISENEWGSVEYETRIGLNGKTEVVPKSDSFSYLRQLPLKAGYAITIHKSQGMTYDNAYIIPEVFSPGQLYVALSRCTSAKGLSLATVDGLKQESIAVNPKVINFFYDVHKQDAIDCAKYGYVSDDKSISPLLSSDLSNRVVTNPETGNPVTGQRIYKFEETDRGLCIKIGNRLDRFSPEDVASGRTPNKQWICKHVITQADKDFIQSMSIPCNKHSDLYDGVISSYMISEPMMNKKTGEVVMVNRPSLAKSHVTHVTTEMLPNWNEKFRNTLDVDKQAHIADLIYVREHSGHGGLGENPNNNMDVPRSVKLNAEAAAAEQDDTLDKDDTQLN